MHTHSWHAVPSVGSRRVCLVSLESPRVHTGQVLMSICTKVQNKEPVTGAICRTKFKFPGHQKIHTSKKRGFTKFNADEFESIVAERRLILDGCGLRQIPNRGPLNKRWTCTHESIGTVPSLLVPTNKSYFPVKKTNSCLPINPTSLSKKTNSCLPINPTSLSKKKSRAKWQNLLIYFIKLS